jgi:uncharacterized protein YndB with AHSA1/START domain
VIQRRVVVPADADRLWRALTDPAEAGAWLGGWLEWTPEEGQPLRFHPGPGTSDGTTGPMVGRVEAVVPGRYLKFRWWPQEAGPEAASEVAYVLEPESESSGWDGSEEDGPATILTVEEVPVGAMACAGRARGVPTGVAVLASSGGGREWSRLDSLCLSVWAGALRPAAAVGR